MSLLEITVSGIDRLEKAQGLLSNDDLLNRILDEGAALLFNRVRTNYINARDPDGNQWVESRAAAKRAETGRDGLTGFDTGNLWYSLQLFESQGLERHIGTNVEYAGYFQYMKPEHLFLAFAADDEDRMVRLFQLRIEEALNAS
jgi:phage gpG-like protein